MRMGELAERVGVDAQTIRYYERIGLLPEPERTRSGYRVYGEGDERRLRFIRGGRAIGLTLGEVREVLAFRERGEPPCAYVTETLASRAREIGIRIAELARFKRELDALLERSRQEPICEPRDGEYCHIIEGDDHRAGNATQMVPSTQ
jgi:DNA-binding transcriptional MerR regulator